MKLVITRAGETIKASRNIGKHVEMEEKFLSKITPFDTSNHLSFQKNKKNKKFHR